LGLPGKESVLFLLYIINTRNNYGKYTQPEKNFGEGNVLAKKEAFSPLSTLKHEIS
jgi:hypothetical protein